MVTAFDARLSIRLLLTATEDSVITAPNVTLFEPIIFPTTRTQAAQTSVAAGVGTLVEDIVPVLLSTDIPNLVAVVL